MIITNYDIENEIGPILRPGEKLIWTGRPQTGILFKRTDFFIIPFSLLWCGFTVFWEFTSIKMGAPIFFSLFGIPFILIGLYLLIGRFFLDARKRAKTVYGITKDRINMKSGIFREEIESLNFKSVSEISYTQKPDKSGTITFGPNDSGNSKMPGRDLPGGKQYASLELIEDVKIVYDKIVDLQRQA
ncbi:MAG: PH domain-containing protein [Flavobacteriales bacterium]|nr:PH domain-containing protein [Flavobacteriales bacterium]